MKVGRFTTINKPVGYRWIFKRELKTNGSLDKYMARLVVDCSNSQLHKLYQVIYLKYCFHNDYYLLSTNLV